MNKKIAFIMENLPGYSGGRYLSYMVAIAFQELGYDTTIYTNAPIENILYIRDFEDYKRPDIRHTQNLGRISFNKNDYDIYVGSPRGGCLIAHREATKNSKAYITFLFDVPTFIKHFSKYLDKNWVNSPIWNNIARTLKDAQLTITFSNMLIPYIKEYAKNNEVILSDNRIISLTPPLNSRVCDKIENIEINKRKNQILVVNRFVPSKNWEDIFKVMSMLNKRDNSSPRLIAITNNKEGILNFANKYNIRNLVDCYSNIEDKEKFKLMKESKLIVNPSSYEGLCMSMIESIRCRIPIVLYDIPVMRYITEKGISYAKYMDVESLRANIDMLLKDKNLYQRKIDEIDTIRHMFSFDNFASEIHTYLEQNNNKG